MSGQRNTPKKTCFVIMGFGEKTDFQTSRTLDLDKTYQYIIKPAVVSAGLTCIRADEIKHSGVIDVQMYEHLLKADVVVADISTYNLNAAYELGIRHALRPYSTITIAEKDLKYPFDVNHIAISSYEHLGKHIDVAEATRMKKQLRDKIRAVLNKQETDSPVYTFVRDLTPPELRKAAKSMVQPPAAQGRSRAGSRIPSKLLSQALKAKAASDWAGAKRFLLKLHQISRDPENKKPDDPYIVQQLALATYKAGLPDKVTALNEARDLLMTLNPHSTHDPETLGLLGAVTKRLHELNPDHAEYLQEAITSYEHGFNLKGDYYNGINLAFLLDRRSASSTGLDAIADCVLARRVRTQVAAACEAMNLDQVSPEERYWVLATLEEAYFGLGNAGKYRAAKKRAEEMATAGWMRASTEEQLGKLKGLLKKSPCRGK